MVTDIQLEQFRAMARAGVAPEQVIAFAKVQGLTIIATIKVLHDYFGLSIVDAKEKATLSFYKVGNMDEYYKTYMDEYYKTYMPGLWQTVRLVQYESDTGKSISLALEENLIAKMIELETELGRELTDEEISALKSNLT